MMQYQLAIIQLNENSPCKTSTYSEGCSSDTDLNRTLKWGGVHHANLGAFRESHVEEALAGPGSSPNEGDNAVFSGLQVG